MFVIDRLLLALSAVIFPDPGMERVFIHAKIARCLSKRLLRLDREFDCAFLKFSGILWRRGLTHRTHLICGVVSVSPCVRKSIATSQALIRLKQGGESVSDLPAGAYRRRKRPLGENR